MKYEQVFGSKTRSRTTAISSELKIVGQNSTIRKKTQCTGCD